MLISVPDDGACQSCTGPGRPQLAYFVSEATGTRIVTRGEGSRSDGVPLQVDLAGRDVDRAHPQICSEFSQAKSGSLVVRVTFSRSRKTGEPCCPIATPSANNAIFCRRRS